jgi:hypothetical protein
MIYEAVERATLWYAPHFPGGGVPVRRCASASASFNSKKDSIIHYCPLYIIGGYLMHLAGAGTETSLIEVLLDASWA